MIITESYKPSTQVLSAQNNGTAKPKTQAADKQSVQPAYQVEISPAGESAQAEDRLKKMFNNIADQATLTLTDWTDEQKKAFASILKAAGKSGVDNPLCIDDFKITDALEIVDPKIVDHFDGGDGLLAFDISAERLAENTGLDNPLYEEYQSVMDKYFTATSAVDQGGVNTFKQLNLEFAGVAFSANEKYSSSDATKQVAKGEYSWNEYYQAKGYVVVN